MDVPMTKAQYTDKSNLEMFPSINYDRYNDKPVQGHDPVKVWIFILRSHVEPS